MTAPVFATLSESDRRLLALWSRSRTLAVRIVLRSRIVLTLAGGAGTQATADALDVSATTVRLWRRRFVESGPGALLSDAPGRGRKPVLDAAARLALARGRAGGDVMTVRERARELGVSAATVSRWRRRMP